jgi:PucR C-terminal helix-turn-helix domain
MDSGTWLAEPLPPPAVAVVRAALARLVDGIVAAVRAESPAYRDVLSGPEGLSIRLGIEQAIAAFLDAIERGERPGAGAGEVWRRLGEAEFQSGRSLDSLRAAFRTGARAAWRGAADLAADAGISTPLVIALAEAIFVYSDELASDVVEGYLRMQSDEAGERERRRRRLAALLLDPSGHDREALERAAELARWPLPRTLAALALAADSPVAITRKLDADALAGSDAAGAWLIIPDPDGPGRATSMRRAVGATGIRAAIGPAVPVSDAARSLRWARLALELVVDGSLPHGAPTSVRDHLGDLIILQDRALAAALVAQRLAPLEPLTVLERERLLQTLEAWLEHQRQTPAIADALHVHPQTVRYRVRRLAELLGDSLDTPDGRFELSLALRALRAGM